MDQLKRLADMRHKVAHYGHVPGEAEAREAIETTGVVETFIKERLGVNRRTYPRSTLLILGKPGLKRLNLWDKWMTRFDETITNREPNWMLGFRMWRDEIGDLDGEHLSVKKWHIWMPPSQDA